MKENSFTIFGYASYFWSFDADGIGLNRCFSFNGISQNDLLLFDGIEVGFSDGCLCKNYRGWLKERSRVVFEQNFAAGRVSIDDAAVRADNLSSSAGAFQELGGWDRDESGACQSEAGDDDASYLKLTNIKQLNYVLNIIKQFIQDYRKISRHKMSQPLKQMSAILI